MQYRVLGKTGLRVSTVGIGCWQMAADGSWGKGATDEESIATIHRAEELGINLLDTSASYGGGHSEEVIGKALKDRRSQFIVASKVRPEPDDTGEDGVRQQIVDICEGSLQRLQTDYIDIYQLHRDPPSNMMAVVMDTLTDLKRQGKIRWIGSSTNDSGVIRQLLELGDLAVVQVGYNLINRGGESTLALAKAEGLGTLIRMPLAAGALTGKYFNVVPALDEGDVRTTRFTGDRSEAAFRRLSDLLFLTQDGRRSMIQAALRFVLDTQGVTTVIPGAKDRKQLEENAAAANVPPLSGEERSRAMAIAGEVGSISALGLIQS